MSKLRPRRSVLYMPAANERALEKAKTIASDALIFDLEDAVSPESKDAARENAVKAASSGDYGNREVTIRCNGLDTPWGAADIAAAAKSCASSIVIPKVGNVAMVDEVSKHLDAAGAPKEMTIWAMIETPSAIFNAREIAAQADALLHQANVRLARPLRADATTVAATRAAAQVPRVDDGDVADAVRPGEVPRDRQAHDARSDDDDVCLIAHASAIILRLAWRGMAKRRRRQSSRSA